MKMLKVNEDCLFFSGYMPCKPHKEFGVHCDNCQSYKKADKNILILKLGGAGEVIRNTPLLRRIKKEYPNSKIFWLTQYSELVPKDWVFRIYEFSGKSMEVIRDIDWDIVYSLDKHEETGALANRLKGRVKKGFCHKDGVLVPFDDDAVNKWETGIFDDLMKRNKKHYLEEIFEICGFEFNKEKYILPEYKVPNVDLKKEGLEKIVALNTGTSTGWKPRIYSKENWIKLAKILLENNYEVIIAGGPDEDEKNKEIAKESGAKYFGTFPYNEFIGLLSLSDIVVSSVSFALHVAIGLEKEIILLNNTFNRSEFYMYEKGVILEPDVPCLMCYKPDFDNECVTKNCMDLIKPEEIYNEIKKIKKIS